MGLEIPEPVQWLSWIIGADWPEGDETAMRRCADAWRAAGTEVGELIEELNQAANDVRGALDSGAADEFGKNWEKWVSTDPQILTKLVESCGQFGETLDGGALDIEYAKYMFIALLIITAIEIAYLIAAAFATFGASTAAIPAVEAGAQIASRTIFQRLLEWLSRRFLGAVLKGALVGALEGGGLDLLVQGIQIAQGNRDGVDWKKTGAATLDGAIGGAISGGIGHGIGKIPGVSDAADTAAGNMVKGMVRDGASEAISGVAGTVATAAIHGDPLTWDAIAKGATSGAFGGAVGGGKDGLNDYNSSVPGGDPPAPGTPPAGAREGARLHADAGVHCGESVGHGMRGRAGSTDPTVTA
ncbi:hypothetical protein [Actinomadura geliboluensis]|uniref:Outer membrane channel protein CpnT-like N-terminal domain-containing protein n=1 Tax=Actinomadura geliboluensis TaxID=882440 RepID=A0A5S4G0F9_9ACTN|nr:hypothetical protein [Actinomadura geliboluensis]TMR26446.1 hypothetical protein ETD96_41240 [Actinomadura geliboluensis]